MDIIKSFPEKKLYNVTKLIFKLEICYKIKKICKTKKLFLILPRKLFTRKAFIKKK